MQWFAVIARQINFFEKLPQNCWFNRTIVLYYLSWTCWCGGMADASDSKSDVGDYMWVQVPPPAPILWTFWFGVFFLCFFAKRIVYGAIHNRYGCFMPLQIAGNFPQTHWETLVCCKFGAGNGALPEVVQFVHFRFRFAANKAQNSAYVVFYMHSRNQMRKNKQFFQ